LITSFPVDDIIQSFDISLQKKRLASNVRNNPALTSLDVANFCRISPIDKMKQAHAICKTADDEKLHQGNMTLLHTALTDVTPRCLQSSADPAYILKYAAIA
jgi:hypothetical protein